MSFLDNLGVNLTNAGKIVSQKAKNTTEATSLSNRQRKERRNIQTCYSEIGKLYYELHKNDPEPEFAEFIDSIAASEELIEELQTEIDTVRVREPELITEMPSAPTNRGTTSNTKPTAMVCLQCGRSYAAGISFCPECGLQLAAQYANAAQAAAAPEQKADAPVIPATPAAPAAPAPVVGVPNSEAAPVVGTPAPPPAPAPETTKPKRFCPYCGNSCLPEHSFCPECGERL